MDFTEHGEDKEICGMTKVLRVNPSSPGAVHDAVQTVGDGEDRAVGKLFSDGVLDQVVCLQVDGCRGLIQD